MTTYNVTLYTRVANNYIIEAESAATALKNARNEHSTSSLNESDWEAEDGYCVHHTDSGVYWWDDEHPVDDEDEEEEE